MTPENIQSIKPIRPEEALAKREQLFPSQVIASFNQLIAQNCINGESRVSQEDAVSLMVENGLKKEEIYKNKWLDVEEIYKNNGWDVKYNKPDYSDDQDFKSYYVFSKPKK